MLFNHSLIYVNSQVLTHEYIYKAFRILLIKDFPTPCKRKRKRFWKNCKKISESESFKRADAKENERKEGKEE